MQITVAALIAAVVGQAAAQLPFPDTLCGGIRWQIRTTCLPGSTCTTINAYHSYCTKVPNSVRPRDEPPTTTFTPTTTTDLDCATTLTTCTTLLVCPRGSTRTCKEWCDGQPKPTFSPLVVPCSFNSNPVITTTAA
ncbi:hypothetical protein TWF225_004955 [Orbilia oligospora]|nr:hypothetical protein TWF225_004955 [Orbilia oligospora]KAF3264966.1 hypothetical protein TWF217_002622 [Orbilia oligospora]KAF3268249.1 hypothetical protein TWF128_008247 [Orbilia oligospora]KAF3295905.1 hypothetical protein TWF132_000453 [Orbilia oligospora]